MKSTSYEVTLYAVFLSLLLFPPS